MHKSNILSVRLRRVAALGASGALAVALVACGSSSGGDGPDTANDGSPATSGDTADYAEMLDESYKGTYSDPKGPVLDKPATGKEIWVITPGLNYEAAVDVVGGVEEAAEKLGWELTVFDAKFSPTRMLDGVQQAVAAGADGIITYVVDCSTIKNGLEQAKQAGIPVINADATDCDVPAFTATIQYPGFPDYNAYIEAFGYAQGEYAVAKTQGKAKAIVSTQTDLAATRVQAAGTRKALESCAGCEIVGDVQFVGADFGPPLQSKISQELLKHPDANAFIGLYDAVLTSGGAQALRSSGRLDQMLVVGGEGSTEGIEMIRTSGMDACMGYANVMQGYAGVNYLAVIFAGEDTAGVHNGIGWQACDEDHNLPPAGEKFTGPVDYKAVYDRLWSLK